MGKLKFLTGEQKQFYIDNGYIKLSGVFSNEQLQEILDEYNDIFSVQEKTRTNGTGQNGTSKLSFLFDLQMQSGVFTRLLSTPALLDAVEDILETANILLHSINAHVKWPRDGEPVPVHQNVPFFPYKRQSVLTIFVHLDDTTADMGGLSVYPGSHKLGILETRETVREDGETFLHVDPEKFPLAAATPLTCKRGDIVMIPDTLLHGSDLNYTDRPRRVFVVNVRAANDELINDDGQRREAQDLVLRGRNVKHQLPMAYRYVELQKTL